VLLLACQVEGDRCPSASHEARLVAIRRSQAQDAQAAQHIINDCLFSQGFADRVSAADLVLTSLCLPPRPLVEAREDRVYRCAGVPTLSFIVNFDLGTPISVQIRRD
jgi:hypothetical protein